ncbi:MAG TPA: hypothetical protein VNV15_07975, partial [Opitutaceae bacterium]|nr:hypothetical protein [Opitutaceae bacterium]
MKKEHVMKSAIATIRVLSCVVALSTIFTGADLFGQNSFSYNGTYTGSDQTLVIPAGATVTLSMWGAGGGTGGNGATQGGPGGYTTYTFVSSSSNSTTLAIKTGGAGANGPSGGDGGGGGRSQIAVGGTILAIAGGGGGGGEDQSIGATGGAGGGASGTAGVQGQSDGGPGGGGTQSAGGLAGGSNATAGSFLQGGRGAGNILKAAGGWPNGGAGWDLNGPDGGAGGGDGYYGGGGAGGGSSLKAASGGGGSGYINTNYNGYTSGTTSTSSAGSTTPPGTSDPHYVSGYGGSRQNGEVIVTVTTAQLALSPPTAGMLLWLKADAGVSANTNGNVNVWLDQSGLGNNATQTTASQQPILVANGLNGLPVVRFSQGSSQQLNLGNVMSGASAGDAFIVVKASGYNDGKARGLWSFGNGGGSLYANSDG